MTGAREEMACQSCLSPLNVLDGSYIHPIHHIDDGHTPVPVPVAQLDTVDRTCDFCGDAYPMWTLIGGQVAALAIGPGTNLMHNYGQTWAACVPCQADLDDARPGNVVDRAIRRLGLSDIPAARERISKLHQAFLNQRRPGRTLITTTAWPTTAIAARDLPKVRDRLARFYRGPDNLPEALAITHARHQLAESLDRSRLYWIDSTFTDLAEHAAAQLPSVTITSDLMPSDDGLLVWSKPVTPRQLAAASWTRHEEELQLVSYRTIGARLESQPMQRLREDVGWLAPTRASRSHQHQTHDSHQHTAVLLATWLLIAQQAAESIPVEIDKAVRKNYARTQRALPDVRIVRIRASNKAATQTSPSTSDAPSRTLKTRFWVTGHWRNQAYGPGRALRRPVYIHPFLRGPEDVPITLSTTVRALSSRNPNQDNNPD